MKVRIVKISIVILWHSPLLKLGEYQCYNESVSFVDQNKIIWMLCYDCCYGVCDEDWD